MEIIDAMPILKKPPLFQSIEERERLKTALAYKRKIRRFVDVGLTSCSICDKPFSKKYRDPIIERGGVMRMVCGCTYSFVSYTFHLCLYCDDRYFEK